MANDFQVCLHFHVDILCFAHYILDMNYPVYTVHIISKLRPE